MAAATPAESLVAVSFGHYLAERRVRAEEILALKELPLDNTETVIGSYALGEHGRTAAALSGYLAVNSLRDDGSETDRVVNRVYQHGLRLHAVAAALGKFGIFAGTRDTSGAYHALRISSALDGASGTRNGEDTLLDALLNVTQDNLDDAEKSEYELAALLGNDPTNTAVRSRLIDMHAIHVAELEHWHKVSGHAHVDLLNIGAQLYCMLAYMQREGAQQLFLADTQLFAVPLPDDLNGLALGDNQQWLEACGPAIKLA